MTNASPPVSLPVVNGSSTDCTFAYNRMPSGAILTTSDHFRVTSRRLPDESCRCFDAFAQSFWIRNNTCNVHRGPLSSALRCSVMSIDCVTCQSAREDEEHA